ncbi:unnamed protein product [Ectocarpus sp. CCAP 1310/34]|nr:unnamed protein product [Ectocarpus sp. CCAP 1310/34]
MIVCTWVLVCIDSSKSCISSSLTEGEVISRLEDVRSYR